MNDTIERLYFSVDEVCHALSINPSKLRFYDVHFNLNLHRSRRGIRKISVDHLGNLAILCRLTEHLTMESARKVFNRGQWEEVLNILESK